MKNAGIIIEKTYQEAFVSWVIINVFQERPHLTLALKTEKQLTEGSQFLMILQAV